MNKSEFILAAMGSAHEAAVFDAVRIQKLIFLIEKEAASFIDGPHFDFKPYSYGPFDKMVFRELGQLKDRGAVTALKGDRTYYSLTRMGRDLGGRALSGLPESVKEYFQKCSRWVLSQSFGSLLSAIYHRYPETAVNSVVPDVKTRYPSPLDRPPLPPFVHGMARTFDIAGVLDEQDRDLDFRQDAKALESDWALVGDDLRSAMANY